MGVLLTLAGQAAFAAAASQGGSPVVLQTIAIGDGNGNEITPLETAVGLTNEVYRTGLQSVTIDAENPNWLVISAVIPAEAGPFTIREIGYFDADNVLLAIADYPATVKNTTAQGVDTTLTIEGVIVVSATANVTVVAYDGTWATQVYVDNAIPPFATIPEHLAGLLETRKAHPAGVAAMIAAAIGGLPPDQVLGLATVLETITGENTTKATHAAGVKAAINAVADPADLLFIGLM